MPSTLFNSLNASQAAYAEPVQQAPAASPMPMIDQNFMNQLGQFSNMIAPLMRGMNPRSFAQSILAQRGYNPAQIQQMFQQFSQQATEIQRMIAGV